MIAYILCEELFDAQLLKTVLPANLLTDVGVVVGGKVYNIKSLAMSLIVRRQVPVLIVFDVGSPVPELVELRRQDIEEIVLSRAGKTPVKVVPAIPEIEIIFFQDVSLLSRLLGYVPPQDLLDRALIQPKKALEKLISQSDKIQDISQIIDRLTDEDIEILRSSSIMQEIVQFLQFVRETASVSVI
ncbi:MAG: hypothetical protein MUE44_34510 [Oscillatoriaceae cyanobacterium Prado104]|jgi:hypothetical protein|nr:hypothetical protein [Oscillatoriaceae cyanobacterium Prado104]